MKTKTLLFILLTLVLTLGAIIPAFAQAVPETKAAEAGETFDVEFKYDDIAGINGTITFSNPDMFSSIVVSQEGFGDNLDVDNYYNSKNGMLVLSSATEVDASVILMLTVSDTAKLGDECIITFEYEISKSDASMPEDPVYSKDEIRVYVLDYSDLNAQISAAKAKNEDEYTSDSWMNMATELDNAEKIVGNATTQDEIDTQTASLKAAIEALVKKPVVTPLDYSLLQAQITRADGLNENEYTLDSWNAMKVEYDKAAALINNADTQDQINAQADALKNLIDALAKKLDYTELNNQIDNANGKNEEEYTQESWAAMIIALGSARSALTDAKTQEEVDAAALALKNAIEALEKKPVVTPLDYSSLQAQITRADGKDQDEYTAESWSAMKTEYDKAVALINKADTQDQINAQTDALKSAIDALEKKPVVPPLDYTALDSLIADANTKKESDYTKASWDNMVDELDRAIATRQNATTQAEIDAQAGALDAAIKALEANDEETGDNSIIIIAFVVMLGIASLLYSTKRKETI